MHFPVGIAALAVMMSAKTGLWVLFWDGLELLLTPFESLYFASMWTVSLFTPLCKLKLCPKSELAGHVLSNIRIEPIDPLSFWLLSHTEWCRQMLSWCELSLRTPTSRIQQLAPFKATLMNIEIYVYCYILIIIGATFLLMWIKSKLFYIDLCG